MTMFSNLWKTTTIGAGVLLLVCFGWAMRLDSLRGDWAEKYSTLDGQAQTVVLATRQATNNPNLSWGGVPAQITALASSNLTLKNSLGEANRKVANLNTEFERLKVAGDKLRADLSTAQRQRQSYADKLAAMALVPGDRANCPALLAQTQDALDLAYGAGL